MKTKNILIGMLACMSVFAACDPIEDESLRDDYQNAGTPITKEELQAAISVTQPYPNQEGVVEGDQYVVLKNSRPDVGGVWHAEWTTGVKIVGSENTTLIYEKNGTFNIWYEGISANQIITTDPVTVTVTNVFDEWDGLFTGATDKADKTAKKTWTFRAIETKNYGLSVCNMGAFGAWNYYPPESDNVWWSSYTPEQAGPQKMVFEYDGNKMTTYDADGNEMNVGSFGYTHNVPFNGVLGELVTTVPVIGSEYDECTERPNMEQNTYWILTLTDEYITLFKPYDDTREEWASSGWYVYYQIVDE